MTTTVKALALFGFIAVCLGAAGLGAMATAPEIGGWYSTLRKPSWNPPNAAFGPVWTTLYLMMAVAGWLMWSVAGLRASTVQLALFTIQLVLNVAWSWIFFRLHRPDYAFAEIIVLWIAIAATMAAFFRRSTAAGWLLVPYLVWVSFAVCLNFAIWQLNPI
jgi:tryptophan-rich sensory protein